MGMFKNTVVSGKIERQQIKTVFMTFGKKKKWRQEDRQYKSRGGPTKGQAKNEVN